MLGYVTTVYHKSNTKGKSNVKSKGNVDGKGNVKGSGNIRVILKVASEVKVVLKTEVSSKTCMGNSQGDREGNCSVTKASKPGHTRGLTIRHLAVNG